MTPEIVRAGVQERGSTGSAPTGSILLQFHWWTFEHPAWLDALHEMARLQAEGLIGALGVTNFDAAHLRIALADGVPIVTNQVSFSLIDRRALGPLSDLCGANSACGCWPMARCAAASCPSAGSASLNRRTSPTGPR